MSDAPLKGYISGDSNGELRIDVRGGTWIIKQHDIEQQLEWTEAPQSHGDRKPVQLFLKPGATIGLLKYVTVQAVDKPLTLAESGSKVVGSEQTAAQSAAWGQSHGFKLEEPLGEDGGHVSVCCWDDPSGFGAICQADDCIEE